MSILNEMIAGLLFILNNLILVYMWVIIIAALLSWVRPDPFNPIVQLLYRLTNPAYALVRRYIPTMFNGIDLSPLIIIILLQVTQVFINALIRAL
jgi:YggT family protein